MTVIDRSNLSSRIIIDEFRDPLRADSGAEANNPIIVDPKADERGANQHFIHTSRPHRSPLYPIIIVEEGSDTASRPDRRHELHEHQYDVLCTIQATSSTDLVSIKDDLRGWFEGRIDTLQANGYEDPEMVSAPRSDRRPDLGLDEKNFTFTGTVNTV